MREAAQPGTAELEAADGGVLAGLPGVHLTELLPTLAKMADRFTLVRIDSTVARIFERFK